MFGDVLFCRCLQLETSNKSQDNELDQLFLSVVQKVMLQEQVETEKVDSHIIIFNKLAGKVGNIGIVIC